MIKNIKLMLVAVMAMLSMNSFAQSTNGTGGIFKISYDSEDAGTIVGLTTDLTDVAVQDIIIPATVTDAANGNTVVTIKTVGNGTENVFGDYKEKVKSVSFAKDANVTEIAASAFAGSKNLATINFANATKLATIGVNAFQSTVITALDLSKTAVTDVPDVMGATSAAKNTSLILVKLPDTWTSITSFQYCSKLAALDINRAANTLEDGGQTISDNAFLGTAIEEFDISSTKIVTLPATLFANAANAANSTLTTVTLRNEIIKISTAFQYCTGIKTVALPTSLTSIADNAFKGCTGLTAIAFPKSVATIGQSAFEGCTSLKDVTFAADYAAFTKIDAMAFGKTAIESITIPACLPVGTADGVESTAFYGCEKLKSFTYNPSATVTEKVINDLAFVGCEGVVITTSTSYIAKNPTAPTNATYGGTSGDAANVSFTPKAYKSNSSKYYICYKAPKTIKIKKSDAKVYQGYLDEGNGELNMMLYKVKNGSYTIKENAVVLILTEKADLAYEDGVVADAGNWMTQEYANNTTTDDDFDAETDNALQLVINQAGVDRAALEVRAAKKGYSLYGWINSASGVGFQKITSGTTFPLQTMYVFAKEPAAGARLTVNWLDEDGNIESTETTGIQETVKNVVENGKVFNLAGQEVDGNYKGVVIKNGKKMIQK